jgi:hypothetical protein
MRKKCIFVFLIYLFSQNAQALDLGLPLSCNFGKDCFISNYFDHDALVGVMKDYSCGAMSQDGYKGTDFILKNTAQMKEGVNVLAGDTGVVKSSRNDIADVNSDLSGGDAVRGYECGNGVIIEHKRGYETQYCHLKKNSVTVKRGDKVEKGQIIGEVGLSGLTNFPYLEFTVRLNGKAIDPFTGEDPVTGKAEVPCDSLDIYPLWDKPAEKALGYITTALLSAGFSPKVPNAQGAREGRYSSKTISNDAKLLSFWIDILGGMKGDKLTMSIISPTGEEIYSNIKNFTSDKRHMFQLIGTKLAEGKVTWANGQYIGKAILFREANSKTEPVINYSITMEMADPTKDTQGKRPEIKSQKPEDRH